MLNELSGTTNTRILSEFVTRGDTVVDIGANQGAFSLVASHLVGPEGAVIAVEPQAQLAAAIEGSLIQSPAGTKIVSRVAMGDQNSTAEFTIPKSYSGMAGMHKSFSGAKGFHTQTVPVRRFDDEFDWKKFPGRVFIKLDIEGSEFAFLRGAFRMISEKQPIILMELNTAAMSAADVGIEDLQQLLFALGYKTFSTADSMSCKLSMERLATVRAHDVVLYPEMGDIRRPHGLR
ncbi:MAG TPA: FkbM family methyltransferase [Chloroflexota bacterium]|nr:FkbM family methyltransferase [Chloroflexota bacterium]